MTIKPLDEEIFFSKDEIIVSKTDLKGNLIYANDIFCRVAEMSTKDVIHQPHNIIRHPHMPRLIFKILWTEIKNGREVFAYVKNMSKTGKYYWVIAHVTPSYNIDMKINGYHSNRRIVKKNIVQKVEIVYRKLKLLEDSKQTRKDGLAAAEAAFLKDLESRGQDYSRFVWSIGN